MTATADEARDVPDTNASYHGVIAARFFCFFFEQLSVFWLYISHFIRFHFQYLHGIASCNFQEFSDNAAMTVEELSKGTEHGDSQLMIPRTLIMKLQQKDDFHRWVKFAEPRGDHLQLQLREFVDGQRLPVKITMEDFRRKFQIPLDDGVSDNTVVSDGSIEPVN